CECRRLRRLVVLVCVPEGAPIRIDGHRAVVAPSVVDRTSREVAALRCTAFNQRGLALPERTRGIAGEPAGISDSWKQTGTRGAVADGLVAVIVDGEAGHPPRQRRVWRPRRLLQRTGRDVAASDIELIPARRGQPGIPRIRDRVRQPDRLAAAD